ncbi:MAG: hypothetical protein WCR21_02300 [Bacteroidota bacterium]
MSVKNMASFLEMGEHNYHKIERNEIGLNFLHANKIAQLVKISIEDLISNNPISLAAHINEKGEVFMNQNLELIKRILKNQPTTY